MIILLYGHKGWIGQQFCRLLDNTQSHTIILGNARIDNTNDLVKEIDKCNPTHIISFIGRTHGEINGKQYPTIDYLEQPGKLVDNIRDNLFSPLSLALICKEREIHYTYLGTGCIFTYIKNKEDVGFQENDLPNFTGSGYSTVKGFTDRLMHQLENNVLNLRIRMPIIGEDNPRNFITKITTYDKICSISNSMTVLPELLPLVINMMENSQVGTINLTNPGSISHNEILTMYKKYVDPNFQWKNFSIEEQNNILASERSNNLLDTTLLKKLYPNVKDIHSAVRDLLKNYKSGAKTKQIKTDFPDLPTTLLFITGGAGFIGSNFINYIFDKYNHIKIINFDALYYCANKENIKENISNSPRYTFIHGNLQSYDLLKYIFESNSITHVIHFAAQSHVQKSFTDSLQYTQDNILGTHNLLEACRVYCKTLNKFIHVSTDEVYGESMIDVNEKHKTEHSILCPTNPYAATKAAAELIAQSYNHSFNMPIVITRGNNVYGPNQYPEKVIPRFIQQLNTGDKITIQGDGSCVRAFLHSYDTANAFQCILENGKVGEIYNIGCDEEMEYSILDVAKLLIRKIKGTEEYDKWITYIEDRPFNDQRYYISNQKLKNLGWKNTIEFDKGLDMII